VGRVPNPVFDNIMAAEHNREIVERRLRLNDPDLKDRLQRTIIFLEFAERCHRSLIEAIKAYIDQRRLESASTHNKRGALEQSRLRRPFCIERIHCGSLHR
jgi:hypothetical protein